MSYLSTAAAAKRPSHLAVIADLDMSTHETSPIRILLVDEQAIVRKGLHLLIDQQLGLAVIGEASNKEEALEIAGLEQPDIILLEFLSENKGGADILQELLAVAPKARVLMLTGRRDPKIHHRALSHGARGVVMKDEAPEALIKAVTKVNSGEMWLEPSTTASIFEEMLSAIRARKIDPEAAKIATLTRREREVVRLAAKGLKNKQIGERLFISEATVSHHLTSIFNKLDVPDRLQLIVYSYTNHLVDES